MLKKILKIAKAVDGRKMKPEECKVEYLGFKRPSSPDQIDFEISGLEYVIAKANERIASLKHSKMLANLLLKDLNKEEDKSV